MEIANLVSAEYYQSIWHKKILVVCGKCTATKTDLGGCARAFGFLRLFALGIFVLRLTCSLSILLSSTSYICSLLTNITMGPSSTPPRIMSSVA